MLGNLTTVNSVLTWNQILLVFVIDGHPHQDLVRQVLFAETLEEVVGEPGVHVELVLDLPLTSTSDPLCEAPQRLGSFIGVAALGPLLESTFGKCGLVVGAPDLLQVPGDLEAPPVADVEVVQPPSERLPSTVVIVSSRVPAP